MLLLWLIFLLVIIILRPKDGLNVKINHYTFIAAILIWAVVFTSILLLIYKEGWNTMTAEERKIENQINKKVKEEEAKILKKVDSYFDSLENQNIITDNTFQPEFSYQNVVENEQRILRSEFSYNTFDEELQTEVTDYAPGKFRLVDSPIAQSLLHSTDRIIQDFFKENFEKGEEIQLELHGFADAQKFDMLDPKYYDGDEKDFPKSAKESLTGQKIHSYILNGIMTPINLKEGDKLTNENLAFLRAYCLYDEYLSHVEQIRETSSKTRVTFHATTFKNQNEIGGKYRKVKIKINIINPSNLPPPPVVTDTGTETKCSDLMKVVLCIMGFLIGTYAYFHYERYNKKRDEGKPKNRELFMFGFFIILAIIFAIFGLYYCEIFS